MDQQARHHLQWPEPERMEQIKLGFKSASGLPKCCGVIDTTHIIMTLPVVETSDDLCDQESNYSMFLQVIVDHEMRFLDIVICWPGSMTIARLLKCSGFYMLNENGKCLNGPLKMSVEREELREFIVRDATYPLVPWLMIPYEGKGVSIPMTIFNAKHKSVNLITTRVLYQLKSLWKLLDKVMWRQNKHELPSIILVCCLLHNIIIDNRAELHPNVKVSDHHDAGYKEQNYQQMDSFGHAMRENLSRHLNCSMVVNH